MGGGGGNSNFLYKKNEFEKRMKKTSLKKKMEKTSKHRILQQEGSLYIHNLVIRGAWNIIYVYIPEMKHAC